MYPIQSKKPLVLSAVFLSIFALSVAAHAAGDPASSIGQSSSSSAVDIKNIFERIMNWGEMGVDILGIFGVLVGSYLVFNSLVKIVQISAGKVQGSVPAHVCGLLVGLVLMAFTAWSFFASGSFMGAFM